MQSMPESMSVEQRGREDDLEPSIATMSLSMLHSGVKKGRFRQQGGGRDTNSIADISKDGKVHVIDDMLPASAHCPQLDFNASQVPSWEYRMHRIEVAMWFEPLRRWTDVRRSSKIAIVIWRVKRENVNGYGGVGEDVLEDVVCFQDTAQKIESSWSGRGSIHCV